MKTRSFMSVMQNLIETYSNYKLTPTVTIAFCSKDRSSPPEVFLGKVFWKYAANL